MDFLFVQIHLLSELLLHQTPYLTFTLWALDLLLLCLFWVRQTQFRSPFSLPSPGARLRYALRLASQSWVVIPPNRQK
jgi:hypothetical protein